MMPIFDVGEPRRARLHQIWGRPPPPCPHDRRLWVYEVVRHEHFDY